MMEKIKIAFLGLPILLLFFTNCNKKTKDIMLSETQKVVFLDSLAASSAILKDKEDNFLEKINKLDMSIQMGRPYSESIKRTEVLNHYKDFLRSDVVDFTKSEKEMVQKCLEDAVKMSNAINPSIVPPVMEMIKTKGRHYGPGVYYTRENRIIIPYDALLTTGRDAAAVEDALTQTLLHEIFHIYSRYNGFKRKKLYAVIGFKNIATIPLDMNDALKERILINPDGVNLGQVIDLQTADARISAIPVITSTETKFQEDKPGFFSYLKFDLYQVTKGNEGIKVLSNEDGTSTLVLNEMRDFFRKIGDNTDYIIHPDEILADNFMLLALSQRDEKAIEHLTKDGKILLKSIEKILKGGTIAP